MHIVYACPPRVVFAQKLRKAARRLTWQLSIPNTFPFKWFSNAVVYNFNQSVNSLTGFSQYFLKWQSLVHQTDCIPPFCSILLFFFYHLPSIPKAAVIPTTVSQSQACEMMIEEQEPLTHQSLSLPSALNPSIPTTTNTTFHMLD